MSSFLPLPNSKIVEFRLSSIELVGRLSRLNVNKTGLSLHLKASAIDRLSTAE